MSVKNQPVIACEILRLLLRKILSEHCPHFVSDHQESTGIFLPSPDSLKRRFGTDQGSAPPESVGTERCLMNPQNKLLN